MSGVSESAIQYFHGCDLTIKIANSSFLYTFHGSAATVAVEVKPVVKTVTSIKIRMIRTIRRAIALSRHL